MTDDRAARMQRDHDAIYGRSRTLPRFNADSVVDRVLAGRNCLSELDVDRLVAEHGITHVLDLRESTEWKPPYAGADALAAFAARGVVRMNVPVADGGAPSGDELTTAVTFIAQALEDPAARVYVHCRAGEERTAAVLVAWYARAPGMDIESALAALRKGRRALRMLPGQEDAVREWLADG
jgi:rhodanese-related sulfurtransferase